MELDWNTASKEQVAADIARIEAQFAAELKKQDDKMQAKGFNYKVTFFIHKRNGGDDMCKDAYFVSEPLKEDLNNLLKSSVIKNDYKITKLGGKALW